MFLIWEVCIIFFSVAGGILLFALRFVDACNWNFCRIYQSATGAVAACGQCAADKSHEIITRVTVNAVKLPKLPIPPPLTTPSPSSLYSCPWPCKMHSWMSGLHKCHRPWQSWQPRNENDLAEIRATTASASICNTHTYTHSGRERQLVRERNRVGQQAAGLMPNWGKWFCAIAAKNKI